MSALNALLDIENKLHKTARVFNNSGKVVIEYKTKTDGVVGDVALKRNYNFDVEGNPVGTFAKVVEWTQEMEDLVKPPITNISLSNLALNAGLPSGTKIADISTTGGTLPVTFSLTTNPNNTFRIDNDNELVLNSPSESGNYQIEITVTDDVGLQESQQFTIVVATFINDKSLLFDGVDEYINCGTNDSLRFQRSDSFTLSAWIKLNVNNTTQVVMGNSKPISNFGGYAMYVSTTGKLSMNLIADWGTNNALKVESNTTLNTGTWYHVAMTYDGSSSGAGVKLYVNGVSTTTSANPNNISSEITYTQNFQISGRGGTNIPFNGHIDEASVWNTDLSVSEINTIYNAGSPADLQGHPRIDNLTHWWRMGDDNTFPTITDQIGLNNGIAQNMEALDVKEDTA